jgi:hypothetical protein
LALNSALKVRVAAAKVTDMGAPRGGGWWGGVSVLVRELSGD